ncbi:uncharacterized protein LOC116145398 [Pistacia vera]|uniref:uncharacterized protein LOC116123837 n=1 Tax=Pistacia vera TaxID=55513 RepID=UPI001263D8ED|nr:uncharacterized protein LOC116123837 [Pistacia vera]XP_031286724.1 uncharacterized protein LOC116145398 [Pistacia vera]
MAGGRKPILLGLFLVMVMGIAIYLRLWTIDYSVSSSDNELLRRQFDLANREAMDESAEWRYKYDREVDKVNKCSKELSEVKDSLEKQIEDSASINAKLSTLQKENTALVEQVELLNKQLVTAKLKCGQI